MRPKTGAFGLFNHPLAWTLFFGLAPLAAFPPLEWHLTAWLAFAPLLVALCAHQGSLKQWFLMGWGLGAVFFAGQFFWLHQALVELAGMAVIPFVVFISLLVGALGLYFGAGCLLVRWCRQALGWHPFWTFPAWLAVQDWLLSQFPFGGIAWGSLAATQPHTLAARWTVPFIGAPGLILLMGAINACWAWSLLSALPAGDGISGGRRRRLPRALRLPALACLVMVTVMLGWSLPAGPPHPEARRMTALLVPGSLSIPELDAAAGTNSTLRYYIAKTMAGFDRAGRNAPGATTPKTGGPSMNAAGPGNKAGGPLINGANPNAAGIIVVWPESAAQGPLEKGTALGELSQLGDLIQADFLIGSTAREGGRDFNALYLTGNGESGFRRYDKRRLVPFGEFVPPGFQWMFGKKVTAGEKDYAAGTLPPVLPWRGVRLGLAICFESVLPGHIRRAVLAGAETVIVVANDAWLTRSAALHHLRLTALRGLEAGRDMIFVSNGGWNAVLRDGRVVSGGPDRERGFWAHPTLQTRRTPWILWGDWLLGALLAAWTVAGAAFSLRAGLRSS